MKALFLDYLPDPKGNHHDFWGKPQRVNIACDIVRGKHKPLSEYDLETLAEMVRMGYVLNENGDYRLSFPVYTKAKYEKARGLAARFVDDSLADTLAVLNETATTALREHSPRHLHNQDPGIAAMDNFINTIYLPADIMIEKGYLSTVWHPCVMPSSFIVLNQ